MQEILICEFHALALITSTTITSTTPRANQDIHHSSSKETIAKTNHWSSP